MTEIIGALKFFGGCGTILVLAFMVLLAMPQSRIRALLLQVVGWLVVVFCILYGISPVDILPEAFLGPFGLVDDLGAIVVAVSAGKAAVQAGRDLKEM